MQDRRVWLILILFGYLFIIQKTKYFRYNDILLEKSSIWQERHLVPSALFSAWARKCSVSAATVAWGEARDENFQSAPITWEEIYLQQVPLNLAAHPAQLTLSHGICHFSLRIIPRFTFSASSKATQDFQAAPEISVINYEKLCLASDHTST